MKKAQGSLEYLIIIAAVLAISVVVVMFIINMSSGQEETATVASCKLEASKCKLAHYSTPDDPCLSCINACEDPETGEVVLHAVACCQLGDLDMIGAPTLEQTEVSCADEVDNDCDGLIDTNDPDCP